MKIDAKIDIKKYVKFSSKNVVGAKFYIWLLGGKGLPHTLGRVCTGELSPYCKSFDKKNVFGLILCVIACNGTFSTGFSAFSLFGAWLRSSSALLQRSWRVLGHSWSTFGRSWATFGASWGALGRILGRLGGILEKTSKNVEGTPTFGSHVGPQNGCQNR